MLAGMSVAPGSAQLPEHRPLPGRGTTYGDPTPKFNMDYFVGDWKFEWTAPDSPLGEGGQITGTETVKKVLDGRFYEVTVKGEGPAGPFTGNGILMYLDTPAGQYATRYEVTRGLALLKTGVLGGDLGGSYSHHWETPPFQYNGSTIQLKGRSYMTSPAGYRVNTEIAIDGREFQNFGSVFYTKQLEPNKSSTAGYGSP
jgi:hypothetical protein